jgi:peroxiredoxin
MVKRAFVPIIFALVLAGVYLAAHFAKRGHISGKGSPAPEFSLADLDGRNINLHAYRGKVVLLNFWATWCEPCRKEIPRFIQFQNAYASKGLQVIGISMDDDPKPVREFRSEYKVNYPLVIGDAKLAESYGGVLGLPISFVIDPQGRIIAKHIGAVDLNKIEGQIQRLLP